MGFKKQKAVIFGPFVGEFGWELFFWQGWVRKVSTEDYKDFYKVAISFEGREVLYPYVDKFIPLPESVRKECGSSRNYICDGWLDGYPKSIIGYRIDFWRVLIDLIQFKRPRRAKIEKTFAGRGAKLAIEEFLNRIMRQVGTEYSECIVYSPWKSFEWQGKLIGWSEPINKEHFHRHENAIKIPNDLQNLEPIVKRNNIHPTKSNVTHRVAIFPRKRDYIRTERNWSEEHYLDLINRLKMIGYEVAILGEPQSSHFSGVKMSGLTDLVNISDSGRLSKQLNFLSGCLLTIGPLSGSFSLSLAALVPSVVFGGKNDRPLTEEQASFWNVPILYVEKINPTVNDLIEAVASLHESLRTIP